MLCFPHIVLFFNHQWFWDNGFAVDGVVAVVVVVVVESPIGLPTTFFNGRNSSVGLPIANVSSKVLGFFHPKLK